MLLKVAVAALCGVVSALPANISTRSVSFAFGSEKVRGVNIGGWLVLEPWITPSIFENLDQSLGIVDELTLTGKLGTGAAYNILKPHVSVLSDRRLVKY
jgi:glucan 1,3-beta-glucosidase